MVAPRYALRDSGTMLGRQLRHMLRYPSLTMVLVGMPVVFLLLFVYVFGETLGAGLGGVPGGRAEYLAYVIPGMLAVTVVACSGSAPAILVAMDMTEGIAARFRTMSISRFAVLAGHVLASLIQTMIAIGVVLGVALLIGYRPAADFAQWMAAIALIALVAFAITWLSVALGLVSDSVETASNLPMILMLLPLLGSGFVPAQSLPVGLRWFAENQPFTAIIETLRALLAGTSVGQTGLISVAWSVVIALAGYMWARKLYEREPVAK